MTKRHSLLGRVVTVIGLSFMVVEIVILGVFTGSHWSQLRSERRDALDRYASGIRDRVRAALLRGNPSDAELDAELDRALGGAGGPATQAPRVNIPPAGIPVTVWVFTRESAARFAPSGLLGEGGWSGPVPEEAAAFLAGERELIPWVEVAQDHVTRIEPIPSGGDAPPPAVLVLESSLRDVWREVAYSSLVAFVTGSLALFATALITIGYLRRALLDPLSRILRADVAARRGDEAGAVVGEGDIPPDEIGTIMRSRNRLYRNWVEAYRVLDEKNAVLARQQEELRRWGVELERLVEEKTSALLRARDRLFRTEKLAALGRLAANVAHEINNPLASIAGYAEEAREELEGDEADLELLAGSLKTIEDQAFRCKEILKRLLGLARAETVEVSEVDLVQVAREAMASVESVAKRANVTLQFDPLGSATIHSDAGSLVQVLSNLLDNAIDASSRGGDGVVSMGVEVREGGAALWVRDDGQGVPEELRGRVFDPFVTTKPVGRGTGLGLAISQSLVERLGGKISLESEAGEGATFTVWIPEPLRP